MHDIHTAFLQGSAAHDVMESEVVLGRYRGIVLC